MIKKWIRLHRSASDIMLSLGADKGVSITFTWRAPADGIQPFYQFKIFAYNMFLGRDPNWDRRCCSNGTTIFCATIDPVGKHYKLTI